MKASELVKNVLELIERHGDCDVKIVGIFIDGLHEDFVISHGSNYREESFWNPEKKFDIKNSFLIDKE